MREDLLEVSKGKTGLFTWSENGETITGLNANYINAGAIDASLITTGKLNADHIGAGTLTVAVGITRGFNLIGDESEGISSNPDSWVEFGQIATETGSAPIDSSNPSAGSYKTYGVKIAVN
nr:MAG TPA: hypothetical protein [Caudoviricetes sp.]